MESLEIPASLVSTSGGILEPVDQLTPTNGLSLCVRTRHQHAERPFGEHVPLKRCWWLQKVGLDICRQPQKVHNLGNACSGYPFPCRDFGSGKTGITIKLLAPGTCQQDNVNARLMLCWRRFVGRLEGVLNAGGKWNRAENEWLGTPSRKWDSHGQAELPASSCSSPASGANSLKIRTSWFILLTISGSMIYRICSDGCVKKSSYAT